MQTSVSRVLRVVAMSLLLHVAASGQCTSGLHPDGYIDFSGLPPSPNVPPSVAYTATLPVIGVPGLTVKVTIPPLDYGNQPAPAYSVDGGTLTLNSVSTVYVNGQTPTQLTLSFNKYILGIGLNVSSASLGPGGYTYSLQATDGNTPTNFATTSTGLTNSYAGSPETQSLQASGGPYQAASILFQGGDSISFSDVRVQSATAPDPGNVVPTNGLQQWLRADKYTPATYYPPVSGLWPDQSGQGHDATPSLNAPLVTVDGRSCQLVMKFTGSQYFSFQLPIAGWSEMTIFLVARAGNATPPTDSFSGNSAISWTGSAPSSNTFVSPYQANLYARFGTIQANNTLYYTRPGGGIGQDFSITRAVHDHGTDSLYVDSIQVQNREGKIPVLAGETGAGAIGAGINNTFFDGEIGEILVYNRVLTPNEAAVVESYLRQKYGTH